MNDITAKLASRKFGIACYLLMMAPAMRWFGLLDQAGLLTIWGSVTAGYFIANVAQKSLLPQTTTAAIAEEQGTDRQTATGS